jgi:hypothetical protein
MSEAGQDTPSGTFVGDLWHAAWYLTKELAHHTVYFTKRHVLSRKLDEIPGPGALQPQIVIIGASFAGIAAASRIATELPFARVIVIEPKDFFEYTPGVLRAMADPSAIDSCVTPLQAPQNTSLIRGAVVGFSSHAVEVVPFTTFASAYLKAHGASQTPPAQQPVSGSSEDAPTSAAPSTAVGGGAATAGVSAWLSPASGAAPRYGSFSLVFDFAVVCTGSVYGSGIKPVMSLASPSLRLTERRAELLAISTRLRASEAALAGVKAGAGAAAAAPAGGARLYTRVTIVGGGLVGVELAGEIASHFPAIAARTVLVTKTPHLLPGLPARAQEYALQSLRRRGIEVRLGADWDLRGYAPAEDEWYVPCIGLTAAPLDWQQPAAHHSATAGAVGVSVDGAAGVAAAADVVGVADAADAAGAAPAVPSVPSPFNARGFLSTQATLQLAVSAPNVFAAGDASAPPPAHALVKMAYSAEVEGHVAAANILAMVRAGVRFPPPGEPGTDWGDDRAHGHGHHHGHDHSHGAEEEEEGENHGHSHGGGHGHSHGGGHGHSHGGGHGHSHGGGHGHSHGGGHGHSHGGDGGGGGGGAHGHSHGGTPCHGHGPAPPPPRPTPAQIEAARLAALRRLTTSPAGAVGGDDLPSLCCVSLGHDDGLVIFDGLSVPGRVAVLAKALIQHSKVSAVGGRAAGEALWLLADPVVAAVHLVVRAVSTRGGGWRAGLGILLAPIIAALCVKKYVSG